ncbi:class I SAM-dependent methyltransferase [Kaistia dalseonensis]|uniref:S-adenosyl-L-methionine-dependent methyltransferase n=1 Tax=Kaistia dalseonensis TaxID=410840 RepID=A0ABU0HBI1_9HYPH|nr:class I SAM-dependent methyltransferase [Kaistia dalseonensis]MCX5497042.1 class I SAM-dependent methyltransferase [Kaistia dalseonensis]MDQ0439668.1 methyltransferase (TIGR00027 family) [Kaistia dalseonensis]
MIEGQPSATAFRTAIRRAAHQLLDKPLVFEDPLALTIIGGDRGSTLARDELSRADSPGGAALRFFLAARSRYAEDRLAAAVARGIRRYVVLGAGLDTFAYRNRFAGDGLRVYEVDRPATQAWKKQQLTATGIAIPPDVVFVPIDFATEALDERLAAAGLAPDEPAFFSWLGVVPYLTEEAIFATLRIIAARPSGSEVVFDYALQPDRLGQLQRLAFQTLAGRVAGLGEPFVSFFKPEDLARRLADLGFTAVEDLAGPDLGKAYLGVASPLDRSSAGHVVSAVKA